MEHMQAPSQKSPLLWYLLGGALVILLVFAVIADAKRREAEKHLQQLSVRLEQLQDPEGKQSREMAKQVIAKVRKHILLPTDAEPTVATVVNVKALRKQNHFYEK